MPKVCIVLDRHIDWKPMLRFWIGHRVIHNGFECAWLWVYFNVQFPIRASDFS